MDTAGIPQLHIGMVFGILGDLGDLLHQLGRSEVGGGTERGVDRVEHDPPVVEALELVELLRGNVGVLHRPSEPRRGPPGPDPQDRPQPVLPDPTRKTG